MEELSSGGRNMPSMVKRINVSYAQLRQVLQSAEEEGIIERKKGCRDYEMRLTQKGKVLAELCVGIKEVIENWNGDETLTVLRGLDFGHGRSVEVEDGR